MSERKKVWEDVTYYSDGLTIAAHLYTPSDWSPGETYMKPVPNGPHSHL